MKTHLYLYNLQFTAQDFTKKKKERKNINKLITIQESKKYVLPYLIQKKKKNLEKYKDIYTNIHCIILKGASILLS